MKRLALLLLCGLASVGNAGQPKSPALVIAPYVDDLTFLVVHADVARLDMLASLQRAKLFVGGNIPADGAAELVRVHAKFKEAGGKDAFVLLNLADGGKEVLIVVPLREGAQKQALLEALKDIGDGKNVEKDGVILMGTPKALAAAQDRQAKAVPELAKALAAVESATVQAIVLPPRPFLRAQEELSPNLPKTLGGGPVTVVTRGFQWAAVGLDISPNLQLKAIAQASNAQAAEDLNKLAGAALNGLLLQADRDVSPIVQFLPMLKPRVEGDRVVLALDDQAIQKVLTPSVNQVKQAAARQQSMNNLKQIALAMHNYHDVNKSLPPPASLDKQEKPLLSWRVHILPYIEQEALYKEFKQDEPWDSEHNKKLISRMPKLYQSPLTRNVAVGKSVYLAPAGPGMIFEGVKGMSLLKIVDGTSNTIMIVEANDDNAVIWTKPDDYKPERKDPAAPLVRKDMKGFHVVKADGSVHLLSREIAADLLWSSLTAAGGEAIPPAIPKAAPPPVDDRLQPAAARQNSIDSLKQLGLAMHNYHAAFNEFPAPANLDKQKKPLLSWRVHILPFIEGEALYREFKLDEPWDSEHNKKLIAKMPDVFKSSLGKNVPAGKTVFLAPAGPGMIFEGPKALAIQTIVDGTSNTIMIVEANDDHAVTWTKPDDYRPKKKDPAAPLARKDLAGFHALFADGSVRMLNRDIAADLLWSLLTAAGGEPIPNQ